ncbi:MAG: hypothetical protein UW94_C0011G0001 [Parcubacteria group bacterium GW2011_GWA2_45_14]|nr:MAG: hypothetical protein UW94_C0011G0001 [Parcubacteria group bacterium GW2011_GWA2_45_14]
MVYGIVALLIAVLIVLLYVMSKCSAGGFHRWIEQSDRRRWFSDGMGGSGSIYIYQCQKCGREKTTHD